MRAGLLREKVIFEDLDEFKTPSGFIRKEYKAALITKAYRKKLSVVPGDMQAFEEFTGNTVILQVRKNPRINDRQRVIYNGKPYKIKLIEPQLADNTYLVTCTKMDE